MTKEMLLSAKKEAEKKLEELRSEAMVQMTFELEDKIEKAYLNIDSIEYSLESIEHTGAEKVTCLMIPIN